MSSRAAFGARPTSCDQMCAVTRQHGRLEEWNDERGFGFITPTTGGPRVFAHVSAFPSGRRPATNDLVTYAVVKDERDRLQAVDATYPDARGPSRTGARRPASALTAAAVFFVVLGALVAWDRVPPLVLALDA